jgi:hypothetical protein
MYEFLVRVGTEPDVCFAQEIIVEMEASARAWSIGIARRRQKIRDKFASGKAFIASETNENKVAGLCYLAIWSNAMALHKRVCFSDSCYAAGGSGAAHESAEPDESLSLDPLSREAPAPETSAYPACTGAASGLGRRSMTSKLGKKTLKGEITL